MSKQDFWAHIDDIRAGMLAIGRARHVPMSPYPREEDAAIWFITAQGTDLVEALERGESEASLLIGGNDRLQTRIEGRAALVQDRAKLEELWNPVAAAWFEGIDDPDIRLIRVTPSEAEVWINKGSVGFAWEIAKARMSGDKPDMGEHFTVTF